MAEAKKIHGHEVVSMQLVSKAPTNDNPIVEPSVSPYYEQKMENMCQEEFQACFSENVEKNSNNVDKDEEEVDLDNNYDRLS